MSKEEKNSEYKKNSELIEDLRNFTTNSYIVRQILLVVNTFLVSMVLLYVVIQLKESKPAFLIFAVGMIIILIIYKFLHDFFYWQYLRDMVFVIITEDVEEIKKKV